MTPIFFRHVGFIIYMSVTTYLNNGAILSTTADSISGFGDWGAYFDNFSLLRDDFSLISYSGLRRVPELPVLCGM
jgi:hypothetical protein